jgi:hypothetical protein
VAAVVGDGQQADKISADGLEVRVEVQQDARRQTIVHAYQPEQDVLGADVVVAENQRLAQRKLESLLRDARSVPHEKAATVVGLRDKLKKPPRHDEASIRQMLQYKGASPAEASTIVQLLGGRLTADKMHVWLSHPKKSHPVPDPEAAKKLEDAGLVPGGVYNWTPVNAISAGKTQLVIDEAERYAAGGWAECARLGLAGRVVLSLPGKRRRTRRARSKDRYDALADLRQFLRRSDGGSAWFNADQNADSSFYFQVFSVHDIASTFEVGEPDDRLLAMASDGGSGWYFIDRRTNMIVMDHIDDADSAAIACAPSVAALVDRLAQGWRSH